MATPGQLIAVSGIDGSGKSSHLAWIAAALAAEGRSYRYVRLRFAALTSVPLLAAARLLGYSPRRYNPRAGAWVIVHRHHRWAPMRRCWPPLFALDLQLKAWWQALRPLRAGTWVLCDRFVLDAIVEVAAILRDERLLAGPFAARLLRLVPPGARTLLLDADPRRAYARKPDVPDLPYLVRRRRMYRRLAALTSTPVVDGNRPFAEVQQAVAALAGVEPLPADRGTLRRAAA